MNSFGIDLMNKCDFEQNDLKVVNDTATLLDCGEKCSDFENCTHFGYSIETRECRLKTGMKSEKNAVFSESSDCGLLKSKMVLHLLYCQLLSKYSFHFLFKSCAV